MLPEVIAIHGITNEMVAQAPLFIDILPQLLSILDGCVLVAHNADFDISFLQAEMQACKFRWPEYPVLDTLKLARKNGRFERNKLGVIAQALGISAEGAHRAMADVRMTEKILYCFLQDFRRGGICCWKDLAQCQLQRCPQVLLGQTRYQKDN